MRDMILEIDAKIAKLQKAAFEVANDEWETANEILVFIKLKRDRNAAIAEVYSRVTDKLGDMFNPSGLSWLAILLDEANNEAQTGWDY